MQDLIIRGGTVIDGTGAPRYQADVAVKDGVITAIGDLKDMTAARELDAAGLIVAPGFFDAHSHSAPAFLRDGSCASKLYQGVTTEVSGQCGYSPFPALPERLKTSTSELDGDDDWYCASFDDFVKRFEASKYDMAVNQAILVGHGSLRAGVIGYEDRPRHPRRAGADEGPAAERPAGRRMGYVAGSGVFPRLFRLCRGAAGAGQGGQGVRRPHPLPYAQRGRAH